MSDSDSDEKSDKYKNANYKSPSKKKRQKKGEGGGLSKTYCFEISLLESNNEKFTEVSFLDLVAKDESRLKKLAAIEKSKNGDSANHQNGVGGLDPYASDDDDKLKAMAASFEAKYAEKPKKPAGKKRKIHEYDDLGEGYDESDPFIDNSECFDEVVPQEITTAHGGFYINTGALEFKSNQKAVFKLSSDDEDSSPESEKAKKPKKETAKKKVQFKESKKAKVKNTDPKRRARIINTDKNIKGPKIVNSPKVGNADVKRMDKLKVDIKKIDVKKHLDVKRLEKSDQTPPKSPEKSIPKPPEIIDLEAQLEALSNSVDLSKTESSNEKSNISVSKPQQNKGSAGSKQENPGYKSLPVKSVPTPSKTSEPKVPSSVKVTKVESKPSSASNGITPTKPGWQNQINFPSNAASPLVNTVKGNNHNIKEKSKTPPTAQTPANTVLPSTSTKESKTNWEPKKPSTSLPKADIPSISKAMDLSAPKVRTPTTTTPHSMFHHDPKNILLSTPSDMSSILGTTAAYFQQKMQQKAEISVAESKPMFSPPNRGYYTSPKASKAEGSTVFTSPKSIPSVPKVSSTEVVKSSKETNNSTSTKQGSEVSQEIGRQAAAAYFQKMQAQKQQTSPVLNNQHPQTNQQNSQNSSHINQQQSTPKNKQSNSIGNQQSGSQKLLSLHSPQQNSQKPQQQSAQMNQQQNNLKLQQQSSQGSQQNFLKAQQHQGSQKNNHQFLPNSSKTDTSPSSTSKLVPDQSKKISSSSGPAKLPTTPNPPDKTSSTQPSQMLTPDMTNSLLGIAQNMMNNLQQQQQSLPQQPARPSQAVTTQQQQTPAFMQQYQQQAATAASTQNKKSSGYDISNLLNSQPLPSAQSNSLNPAARSSPVAQQPARTQQPAPNRSAVMPQQHGMASPQTGRSLALSQQTQQSPRSPSLSQQQNPQVARTPTISHQSQHSQSARSPSLAQQQSQATRAPTHSQQSSLSRPQQSAGSPAAYSQQIPQIANLQQQYQQVAAASRSPTLSQQPLSQQQVTQAALLQQYQQNYYMGGMGGYQ